MAGRGMSAGPWTMAARVSVAIGVGLRFALALINRQANDDHIEVVLLLMAGDPQPTLRTCNECFQPKLFHLACAWLADAFGLATRGDVTVAAQLLNATMGAATLVLAAAFVHRITEDRLARFLAISWVSLNPRLLAINVQATNDSLVILAGAVVLVGLHRWVVGGLRSPASAAVALVAAGLAPHVKGNGIPIALTALAVVTTMAVRARRPTRAVGFVLLFLCVVYAGARVSRSYQDNYRVSGYLLPINMPVPPRPYFFRETVEHRPGVTSIASALLTFRIVDLVEEPYLAEPREPHRLHRTSLWSQLYGRTYFLHFDQWPPSWKERSDGVIWIGRALLVLGLAPAFLLLAGAGTVVRDLRRSTAEPLLFLCFGAAMLAFLVEYSLKYRDFAAMKAIFVFPALPAFVFFYVAGIQGLLARRLPRAGLVTAHLAMLALWVVEAVWLLARLLTRPYPKGAVT